MKISTSLNIYSPFNIPYKEKIKRAHNCGFSVFDFNVCDRENDFYNCDAWRENIREIKKYADSLGVTFYQTHAQMVRDDMNVQKTVSTESDAAIKKSIEASAIAGAKWTAMHAFGIKDKGARIERNIELLRPYAEFAREHGIGLAIENIPERLYWYDEIVNDNNLSTADDLIAVVDVLNAELGNVGVCWDTGHANLVDNLSQYDELKKLGKRLKITHINDNKNQNDDHLIPFYGSVDFYKIIQALREIEYEGTFNYEAHYFTSGLPEELVDDAVRFMYKVALHLCGEDK
ncbi:MAG: sugar phosphate isomerase/epimerase [Clostridia bacterium]|nr:sugar phosphate isomerase/epimerase [Clostridia bacterium]